MKIVTAGNHDHYLDPSFGYTEERQTILSLFQRHNIIYLEHEKYQLPPSLGGFRLFVSPYAPMHFGGAFMLTDMNHIWDGIDNSVDILVTHTPPLGYQDRIKYKDRAVGCHYLRHKIDTIIHPRVHVFGHIHEAHGYTVNEQGQLFINACLCDHRYRGNQNPITFDISNSNVSVIE